MTGLSKKRQLIELLDENIPVALDGYDLCYCHNDSP